MIPHIMSKNNGITIIQDSGLPVTIPSDWPKFEALVEAVQESDEKRVRALIDEFSGLVEALEENKHIQIDLQNKVIRYKGLIVKNSVAARILEHKETNKKVKNLIKFLEKVLQNPDHRAQEDLFDWLEKGNMPIDKDGYILAYKYVRDDFKDEYTGTMDNSPGKIVQMPRDKCDSNPDQTCSAGLHFCSFEYLNHFAGTRTIVMLRIHPKDIVAFPRDYNLSKGRCCKYKVLKKLDYTKAQEQLKEMRSL